MINIYNTGITAYTSRKIKTKRIHCFKPKEPCHAGRQQLKSQLSVLDERNRDNHFENITDSDVEDAVDDLNIVDASDDENDIDIEI